MKWNEMKWNGMEWVLKIYMPLDKNEYKNEYKN
jgi:hypothetical protein